MPRRPHVRRRLLCRHPARHSLAHPAHAQGGGCRQKLRSDSRSLRLPRGLAANHHIEPLPVCDPLHPQPASRHLHRSAGRHRDQPRLPAARVRPAEGATHPATARAEREGRLAGLRHLPGTDFRQRAPLRTHRHPRPPRAHRHGRPPGLPPPAHPPRPMPHLRRRQGDRPPARQTWSVTSAKRGTDPPTSRRPTPSTP